ncbi:MAG: DinB family protein [Pseudomonadota bacterium]
MIDADYVRMMARYNAWQNAQLTALLDGVDADVLTQDRGAFFGSIFATLNHILWGDQIWLNRFDDRVDPPKVPAAEHKQLTPTFAVWTAERFQTDGKIKLWADKLDSVDLTGDLSWYSGMTQQTQRKPLAQLVVHFFNHQTHHRGQVHAMMTAEGLKAPVSDLGFMPEDA